MLYKIWFGDKKNDDFPKIDVHEQIIPNKTMTNHSDYKTPRLISMGWWGHSLCKDSYYHQTASRAFKTLLVKNKGFGNLKMEF